MVIAASAEPPAGTSISVPNTWTRPDVSDRSSWCTRTVAGDGVSLTMAWTTRTDACAASAESVVNAVPCSRDAHLLVHLDLDARA